MVQDSADSIYKVIFNVSGNWSFSSKKRRPDSRREKKQNSFFMVAFASKCQKNIFQNFFLLAFDVQTPESVFPKDLFSSMEITQYWIFKNTTRHNKDNSDPI
jgi:hypothetical protein